MHFPQELDHAPDELPTVVVGHGATAHHTYVRVVAEEEHHLLDDVTRDVEVGAANHGNVRARIADLEVGVDGRDLSGSPFLNVNVHSRPATADVAGQVRRAVRASA